MQPTGAGATPRDERVDAIEERLTPSELACTLLARGLLGPDASGVVIAGRIVPDELYFLATAGYLGDAHSNRSVQLPLDHHAPMPCAAATARVIVLCDAADFLDRFPDTARMLPLAEAAIALPAMHRGAVIGSIGITYDRPQAFDDVTIAALERIAELVAESCLAPLIASPDS